MGVRHESGRDASNSLLRSGNSTNWIHDGIADVVLRRGDEPPRLFSSPARISLDFVVSLAHRKFVDKNARLSEKPAVGGMVAPEVHFLPQAKPMRRSHFE